MPLVEEEMRKLKPKLGDGEKVAGKKEEEAVYGRELG